MRRCAFLVGVVFLFGCGRDPDHYTKRVQQHMPGEWQARAYYDHYIQRKILVVEAFSRQGSHDIKIASFKNPMDGDIVFRYYIDGKLNSVFAYGHTHQEPNQPNLPFELEEKVRFGHQKLCDAMYAVGIY